MLSGAALAVAPKLLGATIVSFVDDHEVRVRVTEVEAYEGSVDPASHAFGGRTNRTAVMFGEAGHLYCYFVYGVHWCVNIVCGTEGMASAVLLRAAQIVEGESVARDRTRTRVKAAQLASGPARLARSLGLTGVHSGLDLLDPLSVLQLVEFAPVADYRCGPRVGVAAAAEYPWRFWLPDDPTVSPYRPGRKKTTQAEQAD